MVWDENYNFSLSTLSQTMYIFVNVFAYLFLFAENNNKDKKPISVPKDRRLLSVASADILVTLYSARSSSRRCFSRAPERLHRWVLPSKAALDAIFQFCSRPAHSSLMSIMQFCAPLVCIQYNLFCSSQVPAAAAHSINYLPNKMRRRHTPYVDETISSLGMRNLISRCGTWNFLKISRSTHLAKCSGCVCPPKIASHSESTCNFHASNGAEKKEGGTLFSTFSCSMPICFIIFLLAQWQDNKSKVLLLSDFFGTMTHAV